MPVRPEIDRLNVMPTSKARDLETAEGRRRLAELLTTARQEFIADITRGRGGTAAHARFADRIDDLIRHIVDTVRGHTRTPVAVAALGGYGRRALCLHSDIDLLIVFEGRIGRPEERFVKGVLHPL